MKHAKHRMIDVKNVFADLARNAALGLRLAGVAWLVLSVWVDRPYPHSITLGL